MGYNSKNYFPIDHPQGQDYEKLLLLNQDCVKWIVKSWGRNVIPSCSYGFELKSIFVTTKFANDLENSLDCFIFGIHNRCSNVWVCVCMQIWITKLWSSYDLAATFSFCIFDDDSHRKPTSSNFCNRYCWVECNAVETFEPFLQNSESKCSFYIDISIWYFMYRYTLKKVQDIY